jgi:hypothetical protein
MNKEGKLIKEFLETTKFSFKNNWNPYGIIYRQWMVDELIVKYELFLKTKQR